MEEEYEIERSVPRAILRISILLVIVVGIWYGFGYFFSSTGEIKSSIGLEGRAYVNGTLLILDEISCVDCLVISLHLSEHKKLDGAIEISKLESPVGYQEYNIPSDIDLEVYDMLVFKLDARNESVGYAKLR